jgi:hypothetical protein
VITCTRRAAGAVATTTLLAEIRQMGYAGSPSLLVRYLEQGRAEESLADPSIRRLTSWITTDPAHLADELGTHRDKLTAVCSEMTALSGHVAAFAKLLAHHEHPVGAHAALQEWIEAVGADRSARLRPTHGEGPKCRAERPRPALQQRSHRRHQQQDETPQAPDLGRAGFALLRQRILLN